MSPTAKTVWVQIGRGIGLGIIAALAAAFGSFSAPKLVSPNLDLHEYVTQAELREYAKRGDVAKKEDVSVIRDDIRELRRMLITTGGRQ